MTYLVDSDVLIAMADLRHSHHAHATNWLLQVRNFATCPITEGALVRYFKRAVPADPNAPRYVLERIASMSGHVFVAADLPYAGIPLESLLGHRQVTDAYLVALAKSKGAKLATFDEALAAVHPDVELISN